MAAAVDTRKRCAAAFLDEPSPAPVPPHHLAKRGRFTSCAASMAPFSPAMAPFDPLDALRHVFPDADPRGLEACFAASGRDINAAVHAYRAQQARDALAHHLSRALGAGDDECCAAVLVEQIAAAADVADAKNRATWMLGLIRNAAAVGEAARLREENAALRERAERGAAEAARAAREESAALKERAAAAERDGAVLRRGVLAQQRRYEEMERDAAAARKKVAELEMANYALSVRLRDAEARRFQTAYHGPHVF